MSADELLPAIGQDEALPFDGDHRANGGVWPHLVHPVAALFPMMTEDELNDLAADIQANGLRYPIVLDEDGLLIDGRNRLEACHRGCVEPRFETLPERQDPVAFILSCNVNRRHLSKGQQAMAVARAECFLEKHSLRQTARQCGLAAPSVAKAKVVLDFAPDLADAVLAGSMPLNEAYAEARRRKEAAETDEAKFARLQGEAPDLAAMVQEERLTLAGALAEVMERKRREEEKAHKEREVLMFRTNGFDSALMWLSPGSVPIEECVAALLKTGGEYVGRNVDLSAERARNAATVLLRYAEVKEKLEDV